MRFDPDHPMNASIAAALQDRRAGALRWIEPHDALPDAYWSRGSHPDVVERLWDQLGKPLPVDCRAILLGSPALVEPVRGVAFALAYGTAYALRIPNDIIRTALSAGCKTTQTWAGGRTTDIEADFGPGWVFGGWVDRESDWVRTMYELIANTPPS